MTKEAKKKELSIMQDTLYNNKYNKDVGVIDPHQRKHNENTYLLQQKTKWAAFTYNGKETIKITKEAQMKVAFRTRNTIPPTDRQVRIKNDVYQIKHMDCPLKYIG
jgi:hypothetical protein